MTMQDRFRFRAWIKKERRYSWFLNLFNCGKSSYYEIEDYDEQGNHYTMYNHDEVILEQCTGLKDKNGKLIYEGDIVHYVKHTNLGIGGDRYAKVFWWENIQGFAIETNYGDYYGLEDFEIEVVGNINENHELFEVKDAN